MKLTLSNRAVLFGLILTASTSVVLAAQAPVIDVSSASSEKQNKGSLTEQLANVERKLDSRNRAQVNIQSQLDDLQNQVNELRGVTELHTHQLSQVLERQRELYQELDRRVSAALQSTSQAASTTVVNLPAVTKNYSDDLTENEAYDKALNLVLKDKRYEQAISEFHSFNKAYPQSTYAPNSHYWLGQLLFNKGKLSEAEQEFSIVVEQFKDSSKRPDALLKLAMVAQQQKNDNKAKQLYRQLLSEYPESTSAQLAKPRLNKLN
ncbi:tol-pal system protein YbgF [Colwellia sp. 4_MG-2023]|jgi:tol-pal system protein YbgF|uniref:tol-pal system protein YbgF n=1 Tax=unclassified Colwellia TaxID=196834 RepID=UPI001C0861E3|nr:MULTISPECIES: tol-pal system protein YbgF [unclassified Colwellia]MBU2924543.1 tol-pal system protein YbgF [Colwellia sp. C2M11]MDO6489058.1 tol-pal system protein YbgF [Colwellia sp. 6_MG-2023]MDO6508347.1 tol-pal system protein YbgF [Colwellia sp. 5_MG-2023]MDO6557007.1 tol-pal system protein YbgF [Colwellia sp. 4_MG-2023]MDO6653982.1 tol-pal system protein YbgF [Colwellia sp. 3_MG-2023]